MQSRLARSDVPVEQTWNLDDLFASPSRERPATPHCAFPCIA